MQSNKDDKQPVSLPENAYSELKEGEEYNPVLPAERAIIEIARWTVGMGFLMAIIFSAAAAYSRKVKIFYE